MAASVRNLGIYDLLGAGVPRRVHLPGLHRSVPFAPGGLRALDDQRRQRRSLHGHGLLPHRPGDPAPVTQHTDPSGAFFQWSDINFQFRLRVWREGSARRSDRGQCARRAAATAWRRCLTTWQCGQLRATGIGLPGTALPAGAAAFCRSRFTSDRTGCRA